MDENVDTDENGNVQTQDETNNDDSSSSVCNDDENDEDDEDDDEDDELSYEEEFMMDIPTGVKTSPRLFKTYERIKTHIREKRVPKLEKLLRSKIPLNQKVDLFELYVLYATADPWTEEQLNYRDAFTKLLGAFEKERKHTRGDRKELKAMEKRVSAMDDVSLWSSKILHLPTSEANKETIFKKYLEIKNMGRDDEEYHRLSRWIKTALEFPFDHMTSGSIPKPESLSAQTSSHILTDYLVQVKRKLDARLYGMNDVKEQILLFLHMKLCNPSLTGCCIGLVGVPGSGKTTIARCLAEILEFPFQQVSFGGLNHAEFLKGHHYTYVGARPGEIVNAMIRMKSSNGILFFDEFDKVADNPDIVATLLHITDFSQNSTYQDQYLNELQINLSRLWFIYSMNDLPENSALRDRIFPIYISGYDRQDKIRIIVDYLFPTHLRRIHMQPTDIVVSDSVASHIIQLSLINEDDKGVRTIEKAVKDIIHKISFLTLHHPHASSELNTLSFFTSPSPNEERPSLPFVLTNTHVERFLAKFKTHHTMNAHVHHNSMYL